MRHPEGMRVSQLEEGMLGSAGILTSATDTPESYGLTEESVKLFTLIAMAGADGLPRSRVPRELSANLNEHLLPLELQQLITWERDQRGRPAYLVLTWKGEEMLQRAKPAGNVNTVAKRRRASVSAFEPGLAPVQRTSRPRRVF